MKKIDFKVTFLKEKNNEEIKILIEAAKSGLVKLFDNFNQGKYIIETQNSKNNEYWHLTR